MPLTTCKKCHKIFTSGVAVCPYCGAKISPDTSGDPDKKPLNVRNLAIGILLLAAIFVFNRLQNDGTRLHQDLSDTSSLDNKPLQSCLLASCPAGARAVTHTTQQKPYYTCKSAELSDYANFVLNVMLNQMQAGGTPKISAKTGEPEVSGNDQVKLDRYRTNAGVSSFEEALSRCYKGRELKVVVLYDLKDSGSVYVSAGENQDDKFWLPKEDVDKL